MHHQLEDGVFVPDENCRNVNLHGVFGGDRFEVPKNYAGEVLGDIGSGNVRLDFPINTLCQVGRTEIVVENCLPNSSLERVLAKPKEGRLFLVTVSRHWPSRVRSSKSQPKR
jgi:hypothetical protein